MEIHARCVSICMSNSNPAIEEFIAPQETYLRWLLPLQWPTCGRLPKEAKPLEQLLEAHPRLSCWVVLPSRRPGRSVARQQVHTLWRSNPFDLAFSLPYVSEPGKDHYHPNIIMGSNAQVALEKFARYFDVEVSLSHRLMKFTNARRRVNLTKHV